MSDWLHPVETHKMDILTMWPSSVKPPFQFNLQLQNKHAMLRNCSRSSTQNRQMHWQDSVLPIPDGMNIFY